MAIQILVVDDEKMIVKGIKYSLEQDGIEVDVAYDGETALEMIKNKEYNLVILDVMLPKLDGIQVCQTVREFSDVPILMLTAKSEDMDKILGLEYGADDYMTKPFNILELKARTKAILRRTHPVAEKKGNVLEIRGLKIDFDSRTVTVEGKEANLTAKEFDLLELMARNVGKVLTHTYITQQIWGRCSDNDVASLRVFMATLRKKLEPEKNGVQYIQTHIGIGYRMLRIEK